MTRGLPGVGRPVSSAADIDELLCLQVGLHGVFDADHFAHLVCMTYFVCGLIVEYTVRPPNRRADLSAGYGRRWLLTARPISGSISGEFRVVYRPDLGEELSKHRAVEGVHPVIDVLGVESLEDGLLDLCLENVGPLRVVSNRI